MLDFSVEVIYFPIQFLLNIGYLLLNPFFAFFKLIFHFLIYLCFNFLGQCFSDAQ